MTSEPRDDEHDLVVALIELRAAITLLVNDLVCGVRPPVACWLAFADVISNVLLPVRHVAFVAALDEHGRGTEEKS